MSKKNETKEKILVMAFQYLNEVGWNNFSYIEFSKKKKLILKELIFFLKIKLFYLRSLYLLLMNKLSKN